VKELLKLIICEFYKLKRKKTFYIAFFTSVIFPILYFIILTDKNLDNMASVVREENGFLILIPLTVIIAANLFFEEHDYDTLKNLMCIPISKSLLTIAKIIVLLIFDIFYELLGYGIGIIMTFISGESLNGFLFQLFITFCTSILLWAAALPCILLVVWFNKSYIISVIIAFAYTILNYLLHINDAFIMVPIGLNIATFLPIPIIFRWLYQFNSINGAGKIMTDFYNKFSPYFVPTSIAFKILLIEAAICIVLMIKVYKKQNV